MTTLSRTLPLVAGLLTLTACVTAAPPAGNVGPAAQQKSDADWTPLFDGKSLDGWQQRNGTATYEVRDGAIVGSTVEGSPNSFLCTTKDYGDFVLEFEVKLLAKGLNSGVQIRSHTKDDTPAGRVNGPQVEIEAAPGEAGYIYGEATGRGWLSTDRTAHTDAFKNDQWNQFRVEAVGPRIQTFINGTPIADLTDEESYRSGFIGLQVHSHKGPHPAQVMWRNIRIQPLDEATP